MSIPGGGLGRKLPRRVSPARLMLGGANGWQLRRVGKVRVREERGGWKTEIAENKSSLRIWLCGAGLPGVQGLFHKLRTRCLRARGAI